MREPSAPQNPALVDAARAKLAPHERAALDERVRARARWPGLARLGRQGFALTGTAIVAVALFMSATLPHGLWGVPSVADLVRGLRAAWPWGFAIGAPVLLGCYALLLQRFDRYRRLAGSPPMPNRLSLRRWREARVPASERGDGDQG